MTELLILALSAVLALGTSGADSQSQTQDGTSTQSTSSEEAPPPPDDDARMHIIEIG